MCENMITTNNTTICYLKKTLPDGSRFDPQIASVINNTFRNLANERDKNSPMGYGCGGPSCCYAYSQLVPPTDCPHFK